MAAAAPAPVAAAAPAPVAAAAPAPAPTGPVSWVQAFHKANEILAIDPLHATVWDIARRYECVEPNPEVPGAERVNMSLVASTPDRVAPLYEELLAIPAAVAG